MTADSRRAGVDGGREIAWSGVDGNHIYFNDPEPTNAGSRNKSAIVGWPNDDLLRHMKNPILCRDSCPG